MGHRKPGAKSARRTRDRLDHGRDALLHPGEVEARGLHRKRLCASLYTHCIYELRFSEDAAARRSSAARLVKQYDPASAPESGPTMAMRSLSK